VVACDTTQSSNSDRVKLYINGVQQTFKTEETITQNADLGFNQAVEHKIGDAFDGYLAEVYFIDGQQLAASDFGQYDSNNVWQPKEFSGSYTAAASGSTTSLSQTGWQTSDQANIWDGDTSTRSVGYADNQVGTVTFDPPLTNVTKVEIYQQDYVHYLNGSSVTTSENGNPGWHTLYNNSSSPITLTSLGNSYTNNTQTVDIFAIRINDSIVDSQTWTPPSGVGLKGTGDNSFYLKFAQNVSNSALGTDSSGNSNTWTVNNITAIESKWSDYLTSTASFTANQGPDKAFDNSLSGPDVPYNDSSVGMTWAPPGGLAYSSKVEIYVGGISGFTYSLNGASAVSATINSWNTVATGSGTINTLVFDRSSGETHGPHAIRVDNVVLVDGTTPSNTDSMIDTPTNYTADSGNNGGNYCTLNPLKNSQTLSNGNLDVVGGSSWQRSVGTIGMYSGKYYWEYTITASNEHIIGVGPVDMQLGGNLGAGSPPGSGYGTELGQVNGTGANGSWSNTGGSTAGDIIGIAFDADNGSMYVYKNGTALNSGAASHTGLVMPQIPVVSLNGSSRSGTINFGQRPFKYTPPTGYVSLCTENLSESAYASIPDGSTAFDIDTYTGNGSTHERSEFSFSPDFVWIKSRVAGNWHQLFDTIRGAQKRIYSNTTDAEATASGSLDSFDSDGFTLGSDGALNSNGSSYVAWAWDAGTSTASNTDGSITSSVRASQTNGISIVGFTGNGSGTATIGHGLNATPELIILKDRDNAYDWLVYTQQIDGSWDYLYLNKTDAKSDSSYSAATSSVFSYGTDAADYIAYCFTPVAGFSAFGSYEGTGSASTAAFVYTGMRPRWILVKNVDTGDSSADWFIYDTARSTFNAVDDALFPNRNIAEANETSHAFDILSNGFRVRSTSTSGLSNKSGNTYVWAAFAEHPFKTARAR
jgi:hypothetical protein